MNNAYIRAQQCKVKEAKFPFVKIGTQYWTTKNLSLAVTPQGNTIPEMQASGNFEKIVNGGMEGAYIAGVAPNWSSLRGNVSENITTPYAGSSSQNVTNPIGATGHVGQPPVSIVGGVWYCLSFYAKNISGSGGRCSDPNYNQFSDLNISDSNWTLYRMYFKSIGTLIAPTFYASTSAVSGTNGICFDNVSLQQIGWSGSQELYDGIYAQTSGTVEQKTYAAVKAAAMWCNYNNDPILGGIYGKLYNWFAVKLFQMDIDYYNAANPNKKYGGGWRIPTQAEFQTLSNYLGGDTISGGKMKKEGFVYWNTPNTGADNSSGFSAIGSGSRNVDGTYANFKNWFRSWGIDKYVSSLTNIDSTFAYFDQQSVVIRGYPLRLIKS